MGMRRGIWELLAAEFDAEEGVDDVLFEAL